MLWERAFPAPQTASCNQETEVIIITESPAVLKLFMLLDFYYKEELQSDFSLLLANPHEDNALRRVSNHIAPV